jgi:3-hydroxyisobutyrate dehydrogenase-like beta-hydroxyacid dehydrogenase
MTSRGPGAATRVLLAVGSLAVTLGMVAAMSMSPRQPLAQAGTGAPVRVVIADSRIDPETALAAARRAAAAGENSVQVPIAGVPLPAAQGGNGAAHTTTRGS